MRNLQNKKTIPRCLIALMLLFITSKQAISAEWYSGRGYDDEQILTCFVSTTSDSFDPTNDKRTKPILSLWIRSFEPLMSQFSVMTNIETAVSKNAYLIIDGISFDILVRDGNGWLKDTDQEVNVFQALRESKRIQFRFSKNGREYIDSYYPNDFEKAVEQLTGKCTVNL